jgi:uncharacterized membrane protein YtjA (UPF0391 family)
MLRWALIFLIVSIVAGLLGFTGAASVATTIALTLFWVFLAVTLILFLSTLIGGGRRPVV